MVSERPYENEEEERTYIEGQVMAGNGGGITGVFDFPHCAAMCRLHGDIVFMGYRNTRLPETWRREQMEYFKKAAEELMELRRSGHLPTIQHGVPEDENNDDDDKVTDCRSDPLGRHGVRMSTHG